MIITTIFFMFIPILSLILLLLNFLLAPNNPYQEKNNPFECGFTSFLGQNRTQFSISYFIFGLLFLLFDLEILLVYPYSVSTYSNDIYGLGIMIIFFIVLTIGFVFELGKNALTIYSKQLSISFIWDMIKDYIFVDFSESNILILLYNFINNLTLKDLIFIVINEIKHKCKIQDTIILYIIDIISNVKNNKL